MARLPLKRRLFFAVMALLLVVGFSAQAAGPTAVSADTQVKAIYVWWGGYNFLWDASERDYFLDVNELENINTIYFNINEDSINFFTPGWRGVENAYRDFIQQAQSRGMETHAMIGGSAATVLADPEIHRSYIEAILKYNAENPGYEFAGINWDIEPLRDRAGQMVSYMQVMKSFSYSGQTILSQGLTLSVYTDPPKYLGSGDIAAMYQQFDLILINSYADNLSYLISHAADGPDLCQQLGIPFLIGFETDEGSYEPDTLFQEGKDAYHTLEAAADNQWGGYSQYAGQYLHHFEKGVSWWYMITDTGLPSGEYQSGQQVAVTVTLRRSDSHSAGPIGVRLIIRDDTGNTWEVSRIVVLGGRETRTVTLQWTVPASAPDGSYDIEVSTWDIDLGNRTSTLYYTNFNGDKTAMEAIDMAELEAMSLSGKRDLFVPLDNTGWNNSSFTIGGDGSQPDGSSDVNGDGAVNVLDMIMVGQRWGETGPAGWVAEDVNEDGAVNVLDTIIIGQSWTG